MHSYICPEDTFPPGKDVEISQKPVRQFSSEWVGIDPTDVLYDIQDFLGEIKCCCSNSQS
jgi:hypothetical protein